MIGLGTGHGIGGGAGIGRGGPHGGQIPGRALVIADVAFVAKTEDADIAPTTKVATDAKVSKGTNANIIAAAVSNIIFPMGEILSAL